MREKVGEGGKVQYHHLRMVKPLTPGESPLENKLKHIEREVKEVQNAKVRVNSLSREYFNDLLLNKKQEEVMKILHSMLKKSPLMYKQLIKDYLLPELSVNTYFNQVG